MSYEIDHTEYNPYAKKVYAIIEGKWQRLRSIAYEVNSSSSVSDGVESFRLERASIIKILTEYIGQEETDMFSKLPTNLLKIHPSQLALNYTYRGFCKNEVDSHTSFLWGLMKRIKAGSIEYKGTDINTKREVMLRELYKFKESPTPYKSLDYLADLTGFEVHEMYWILEDLKTKNMLREANFEFAISPVGAKEVERMDSQRPIETFAQKRYRVLRTIYEMAPNNKHGAVDDEKLAQALGMDIQELMSILLYWREKNMVVFTTDQSTGLTSNAIDEIEEKINEPNKPTPNFPGNVIYNTFNAPVTGLQQQTHNSTQNINQSVTNNPEFDKAISTIIALIRSSSMAEDDKQELTNEVEAINKLALKEPSTAIVEKAKLKLEYLKTALTATDIAIKVTPYLPALYTFFEKFAR